MGAGILGCFKDMAEPLQPIDAMSLQLWLAILCESYRIPGYRDISPQAKIWCIYHCQIVATEVLKQIEMLSDSWSNLTSLPMLGARVGRLETQALPLTDTKKYTLAVEDPKQRDWEFNYKCGSNRGLLGSGRGLNGSSAPVGLIWAEFQLKRSHGDPFREQNHVL